MDGDVRQQQAASQGQMLLCLGDQPRARRLAICLAEAGCEAVLGHADDALRLVKSRPFDVLLLDAASFCESDADTVAAIRAACDTTQLILCGVESAPGSPNHPEESCLTCRSSADDVVFKDEPIPRICSILLSAGRRKRLLAENRRLKRQLWNRSGWGVIGQSPATRALRDAIVHASTLDAPVLIHGEHGTGTNFVAQAVHESSPRAHRPLIKLSCRLLTDDSLQRELFGTGTGACGPSHGGPIHSRLEQAAGGTLVLDDVDAATRATQRRLMRLLKSSHKRPARAETPGALQARVIATTHVDLRDDVNSGRFDRQLYELLTSVTIRTPPLRERRGDIGLLTEHFLGKLAMQEGKPPKRLSLPALDLLQNYDWPQNVRELQNVVARACSLDVGGRLSAEMVRPWLSGNPAEEQDENQEMTLKEMERKLIEATFARCDGNRERTARLLKIGLRTLSGKLREYGYPPRGGPGSNVRAARARVA